MHAAWLFTSGWRPWMSQRWVRAILGAYYGHNPADAYLGDEDQGQMSAWFVMSSLGLFQTDGGCRVSPIYEIASPLYPKIVLHLSAQHYGGKTFTILARNASPQNRFIQSARLDGQPLNRWWIGERSPARRTIGTRPRSAPPTWSGPPHAPRPTDLAGGLPRRRTSRRIGAGASRLTPPGRSGRIPIPVHDGQHDVALAAVLKWDGIDPQIHGARGQVITGSDGTRQSPFGPQGPPGWPWRWRIRGKRTMSRNRPPSCASAGNPTPPRAASRESNRGPC